ncbi:MAG: cytochrome c biogenesis CcdA family protein [Cognatishimia sp.]
MDQAKTSPRFPATGKLVLSFFALLLVAFSWLVFPYLVNGKDMLFTTGQEVKGQRIQNYTSLNTYLGRFVKLPSGVELTALYATEEYFEYADRAQVVSDYRPDTHFVFFVNEDVHTGDLPSGLLDAYLKVDGEILMPVSVEAPEDVEHHRTNVIRFSRYGRDGQILSDGDPHELKLYLSHAWNKDAETAESGSVQPLTGSVSWQLPLEIPEELLSRDTFTTAMVFSLSAGLLAAVLTPCLLQLAVIFLVTLGGMTAQEVTAGAGVSKDARKRILTAAFAFVVGYVLLFTVSGALIGLMGKQAQLIFANYARPIAIGSGVIVIAFGIWMGIRARAPMLCRLPGAGMAQRMKSRGPWGAVLISIAFSLGCMSCFGGAIIGTLFIYVGALGSPTAGAAVMGLFAAGVAVPFMLAAVFFTKAQPMFMSVARHSRSIGFVGSMVMILFGVALITDNFHTLSDAIYPYLGLG